MKNVYRSTKRSRSCLASVALLLAFSMATPGLATEETTGRFCWFDLLTEDVESAAPFYERLFGWVTEPVEDGNRLIRRNGGLIGGITRIARDVPESDESTWLVGFEVADLPAAVAAARRLGATIHEDVTDAPGLANWAVVEDPQGAQVLLLDPQTSLGGQTGAGAWAWAEIWTSDPPASMNFYSEVIGWQPAAADGNGYVVFLSASEPRAGVVEIDQGQAHTGWAPYIGVENLAATLERARELGGSVLLEPTTEVHDGRVAAIADPTGVAFLIYQLDEDKL